MPDPYPATNGENSGGNTLTLHFPTIAKSADDSQIRSRRKEKNQYRSNLQETTLSRPETDGSIS